MNRRPTFAELREGIRTLAPTPEMREPERLIVAPGSQSQVVTESKVEPEGELTVTTPNPHLDLADRLARAWGLGDRPDLRRRFFERVQRLAVHHGQVVLDCVAAARMQAHGKSRPAVYFCHALALKLADRGLVEGQVLHAW